MDIVTYALLKRIVDKFLGEPNVDLSDYASKTEINNLNDNITALKSHLNGISFGINENGNLTYEKKWFAKTFHESIKNC